MVRNCAPENLEIPGLVSTDHPGMTDIAWRTPLAKKSPLLARCAALPPCLRRGER